MSTPTLANVVVIAFWLFTVIQLSNGDIATPSESGNNTFDDERRNCPLPPPVTIQFTLSETDMTLVYEASKLCLLIYPDFSGYITQEKIASHRKNYERFDAWGDWNDQGAVAKIADGTCHATFAGSSCWNPLDQWQNLNPLPKSLGDNSCWVRRGYFNAYNTSYKDEFRIALDDCMASCNNDTQCDLVLSGFSQGGAVAVVASVDLKHYNPIVITFGAPQPFLLFMGECSDFDASKHYISLSMFLPIAMIEWRNKSTRTLHNIWVISSFCSTERKP
jgi:Lipase (class 3)